MIELISPYIGMALVVAWAITMWLLVRYQEKMKRKRPPQQ